MAIVAAVLTPGPCRSLSRMKWELQARSIGARRVLQEDASTVWASKGVLQVHTCYRTWASAMKYTSPEISYPKAQLLGREWWEWPAIFPAASLWILPVGNWQGRLQMAITMLWDSFQASELQSCDYGDVAMNIFVHQRTNQRTLISHKYHLWYLSTIVTLYGHRMSCHNFMTTTISIWLVHLWLVRFHFILVAFKQVRNLHYNILVSTLI